MIPRIAVVVGLACASAAWGQMAYSTFSANWGYEVQAGSNVTGATSGPGYTDTANQFTAQAGGAVTDLWVAVAHNAAGPNNFDITLRADENGSPGAAIQTWNLVGAAFPFDGQHHDPVHVAVSGGPVLTAGTAYWLDLHAGDPASWMVWHFTSPPIFENVAQRSSAGGVWNVLQPGFTSAFAVGVPAPASLLVLVPLVRRRRR